MAFQYQSLAAQLLEKIQNAELPAGQKLLSLRQFANLQKVSLNTAKSCYELLESQGYIHVKNKSGYFVSYQKNTAHLFLYRSILIFSLKPVIFLT